MTAVLLDVDGTLIDSNYQHALAWYRALRERGRIIALWELHRHIGMGGDQLVKDVCGEEFDAEHGDAARAAEKLRYEEISGDLAVLDGAKDLIAALSERGADVVLASSAAQKEVDRTLKMLDAEDLKHTSSDDVEETKPEPDLIEAALAQADDREGALLIGDSTWDCEAAKRAGVRSVAVLTGGFSEEELKEAGAERVYRRIADLLEDLDELLA
jgi:HAD superfamily hydrolase (TIGR01549 family)